MKFMFFVLPTIPGTLEDRKRLRPIGRNNERYQQMLGELRELAVLADDAGFDVLFHNRAPLPLRRIRSLGGAAADLRRIRGADQADQVRPARPRAAVLGSDPRGGGAGGPRPSDEGPRLRRFRRGYQDRWVNVLGQQYHVTGAPMDGSAIDNHNRRVYEETLKVIRKAWTEEAFEYNGEYYKVPFPYEEGIRRWPVADWTRQYGAPGEIDEQGVIRKIPWCRSRINSAPADVPAVLGERKHHPLHRAVGHRSLDSRGVSAGVPAALPGLPGCRDQFGPPAWPR